MEVTRKFGSHIQGQICTNYHSSTGELLTFTHAEDLVLAVNFSCTEELKGLSFHTTAGYPAVKHAHPLAPMCTKRLVSHFLL